MTTRQVLALRPVLARRRVLAGGALLILPATARAAEWPERPVRMIIPFAAGAGADIVGRSFAEELAKALGQPVVVDNKGGAGGLLGTAEGARAPADGYTLLLTSQGTTAWNMGMYKTPGYDPLKDLTQVSIIGALPNTLVVSAASPFNSVADLIAQAKAKPGGINYASSGNGSAQHLAGELFASMAGVQITHVAYKGGGPALTDVMSGHVPVFFASLASSLPFIQGGKLRALAVTGKTHSPALPQLPTVAEAGLPGYEVYEWNAVFVPAGTPAPVVERLSKEFAATLRDPEVRTRLEALGAEVIGSSPAELDNFRRAEITKWTLLAKDNKIQVD